jgi:hypothetical protein
MSNTATKFNKNQPITIVQWNCKSVSSNLSEFQQSSENTDVIISETWLDEQDSVYLKGFDIAREEKKETKGQVVRLPFVYKTN